MKTSSCSGRCSWQSVHCSRSDTVGFLSTYPEYGGYGLAVLLGIVLVVVVVFLAGFICFWVGAYAASVQMWRRAVSMGVLPAAIVITVLYPLLVLGPFVALGNYIYRTWSQVADQLEQLHKSDALTVTPHGAAGHSEGRSR
jgi:hypothetical protein